MSGYHGGALAARPSRLAVFAFAIVLWLGVPQQVLANAADAVRVHEITMAAPDIVRVEVRDGEVVKGPLVGPLPVADPGSHNTFLSRRNPHSGQMERAQLVGPEKRHLKFMDRAPTQYLNRQAADDAGGYASIGGRNVVAVYRKSEPYDYGQAISSGGGLANVVSMRHFLYLKLDSRLEPGDHAIAFPPETRVTRAPFVFDDKKTRASSIRATQVGHRSGDIRKYAYLSQWIPGWPHEGAVEFLDTYGVKDFHVIDARGAVVFAGEIVKRIGPTEVEENTGFPDNIRYASLNTPPRVITAISRGNPAVITSASHGFVNGDVIILRGIGGIGQLEGRAFKVAEATRDTFALQTEKGDAVNTLTLPAFQPKTYLPGYNALAYFSYKANRAATYVYGLDYSAWRPQTPGDYRLHIPGLGVSDPFRVDEAVWYRVARNAAAGEYHHRHGIALDGRFGYTRGVSFRDGVNGTKIYWSRLPAIFSSEWTRTSLNVHSAQGADRAKWLTDKRATGWYGATMDAGDWDESIDAHVPVYYALLDLGYEKLPSAVRNINLGLPKSTEVLDAALYAGTDFLPDAVHQAIWYLDAYRRLQREDGAVGAGLGFDHGGAGAPWEPSSLSRSQAFIYAPDPASNFIYALGAAKLAVVLKEAGFGALASVWTATAEAAWNWAEKLYQSGLADGAVRDAYFLGELNVQASAGWTDAQYRTVMAEVQKLMIPRRLAAAGALFRLTERDGYRAIIEGYIKGGYGLYGLPGTGLWEYVYSPRADPTLKRRVLTAAGGFQQAQFNSITPYMKGRIGYKNLQTKGSRYISNGWPVGNVLTAYIRTGAPDLIGMMQDGQAYTLGANQYGASYTNGLGARTFARTTLHVDARSLGLREAPNGITHYGWDQPGIQLRIFNFSSDSPLNFTVELPTGKFEADHGTKRIYEPYRLAIPFAEHTVANPFVIFHMEYTFHQTIIPQQIMAMWLHAWDGNTATK